MYDLSQEKNCQLIQNVFILTKFDHTEIRIT